MTEPAPPTWRRLASSVRMDLTPLRRYRDYRLLVASGAVSMFGTFITMVAAPLQMKQLTNSYVDVGLIGVAEFLPMIVCGLWGGAIADAHDRQRVVVVTEVLQLLFSAGLMANALAPHPQPWAIYVMAAGAGAAGAVQRPSLDAILPRIVGHKHQAAANVLTGLQYDGGAIIAPAIGGVLAAASLPAAYAVDVLSFVVSLIFLARVSSVPPAENADTVSLAAIGEGIRYAIGRRDLLGTYLVDMAAMAFAMPEALFPFLADRLHAPHALGLLYSAGAVGGVVATVTSGWTSRVHRHGRAIVLAATGWGVGMALAGAAPGLWLVLGCLALAGAADMISGVFRSTIWNQTIPDRLRGRLAGIELLSYTSGPTVGNARAGLMAQAGGVRFSIGAGGLLCVAGVGITAVLLPALLRYDDRTDPNSAAVRQERTSAGGG